jgi:hypothetical protein
MKFDIGNFHENLSGSAPSPTGRIFMKFDIGNFHENLSGSAPSPTGRIFMKFDIGNSRKSVGERPLSHWTDFHEI